MLDRFQSQSPKHLPAVDELHPSIAMTKPIFLPCTDGTRLGLGGAPLGNLFTPISDAQAHLVIETAWAEGCRTFDTAPHYGHGLSERRMGDALRQHGRNSLRLSSKVGRLLTPDPNAPNEQHGYVNTLPFVQHWDFSRSGIRRSIEDSLQRLGMTHLDAVFIHDIDAKTHGTQTEHVLKQVLDDTLPTLHRLKEEGLLSHIGLGVNDHHIVTRALEHASLDCLLLAGRYSLLDQAALALIPTLQQKNIALALGGVFNSGILAQRLNPQTQTTFDYVAAPADLLDKAMRLQTICDQFDVPLSAAALQFALAAPAEIVLLGIRTPREWQQARQAAAHKIPQALWQELRELDLIPPTAPIPSNHQTHD